MGGGMFRLLSIILAIFDSRNGVVLIDEIENGFSYTSQGILWNAIIEAAREFNVQIFATTHSMECVRAYSSSYSEKKNNKDTIRLYRIEKKQEDFKIIAYNYKQLKTSLESGWEVR